MNKINEIITLYGQLKKALLKVPQRPNFFETMKNANDSLTDEKKAMLKDIRTFRNQVANSSEVPKVPANYQEWIDFMNEEIAILNGRT